MKITFLQSSLWLSGGARAHIEFGNRLVQRGHEVAIVIPRGAIDPEMKAALGPGLKIIEAGIPLAKLSARKSSLLQQIRLALSMTAAVPKSDIILATHTPTTVISLLAGGLLRRGTAVWFYMDYPGMFAGRRIESWLLRNALRWHRAALVISRNSADELLHIIRGDVRFVGLGLSDDEIFFAAGANRNGPDTSHPQIMYLGDFRLRKGLADFLEAVRQVHALRPEIRLLLVLKEEGRVETAVPHQIFNRPDTETLARCYAESDLFVSSSWYEGFGLPPLEAMACGTPVVLTNSGGIRDFARDGENCLIVAPQHPDELAAAILRVLEDPEMAARFSRSGPPTAAGFTWEKATDRLEEALKDFCRK